MHVQAGKPRLAGRALARWADLFCRIRQKFGELRTLCLQQIVLGASSRNHKSQSKLNKPFHRQSNYRFGTLYSRHDYEVGRPPARADVCMARDSARSAHRRSALLTGDCSTYVRNRRSGLAVHPRRVLTTRTALRPLPGSLPPSVRPSLPACKG